MKSRLGVRARAQIFLLVPVVYVSVGISCRWVSECVKNVVCVTLGVEPS